MSLLVFLTFMGVFTNQFIPVWMGDNESAHMSDAIEQILALKSDIDGLITDYADSLIAPTPLVIPVTLHAQGIPVFAAATSGILSYVPEYTYGRPSLNTSYTSELEPDDGRSGGELRLYCPNRYYVEQSLIYESGAVILNQSDGEFVLSGIQLSVQDYNNNLILKMTQVSLQGVNKTIGGVGTKTVHADLMFASTIEYTSSPAHDVNITIATKHGMAWANYFKRALNSSQADLTYGVDFTVPSPTFYDNPGKSNDYYIVNVKISGVGVFYHTKAIVQISLGELGV
ncbi:MAG: hypothetical protein JSV90_02180 [Methanobacteriota archaeon]|nr:MAG: hypothetical protein JSV90_02180 [Euryarchaeota archaeon]